MIEISVALIAVAFTVLVIYLIITLRSARASLQQTNETLIQVQGQLDRISEESLKLIHNTTLLTEDVHGKIKQLDSLFESISHVGESVNEVTSSVKQVSATVAQTVTSNVQRAAEQNDERLEQILKYASAAMKLWFRWKGYKSDHSEKGEDNYVE